MPSRSILGALLGVGAMPSRSAVVASLGRAHLKGDADAEHAQLQQAQQELRTMVGHVQAMLRNHDLLDLK